MYYYEVAPTQIVRNGVARNNGRVDTLESDRSTWIGGD